MADPVVDKSQVFVRIQRNETGPIDTVTLEYWETILKHQKDLHLVNDAGEKVTESAAVKEAVVIDAARGAGSDV